jgi:hypothetical protein
MKKSLSVILAVMFALAALFTISVVAFADDAQAPVVEPKAEEKAPETTVAAPTTAAPTTAKPAETRAPSGRDALTATSKAETTTAANISEAINNLSSAIDTLNTTTTLPNKVTEDRAETVVNDETAYEGQGNETSAATSVKVVSTTKKAAAVNKYVPNTGSNAVVPAVALLALAAGVAAVVKTKKEEI